MKYLDGISEEVIAGLNIPTGVPLVYNLDENLKPIPHPDAIAPLTVSTALCYVNLLRMEIFLTATVSMFITIQGRYVGDQADIRRRIEGVVVSNFKLAGHQP